MPIIFRFGEVVPLGPSYLASYAAGVRTGINELAPKLIGQDPTKIGVINELMDFHLKGHPYVKSPLDMACWDILGKVKMFSNFKISRAFNSLIFVQVANLPTSSILGGSHQDSVKLYRAIPQRPAQEMAQLVKKYKDQVYIFRKEC